MRQISFSLIISALFLTLIIFTSGVLIGSMIDRENLGKMEKDILAVSDRTNSLAAILLLGNSSEYCPYLENEAAQTELEVEQLGYSLTYLEDVKNTVDVELKKKYFSLQLNSYLLSGKVRSACSQNFTSILYFYSNKDCFFECREQGKSLLDLKADKRIWAKIYSFDGELGSASADALKRKFNITSYPSVVVDGEKYEGVQSTERLAGIILGEE